MERLCVIHRPLFAQVCDDATNRILKRCLLPPGEGPRSRVLCHAKDKSNLYTVGNEERSILATYRRLWSLVYAADTYGACCVVETSTDDPTAVESDDCWQRYALRWLTHTVERIRSSARRNETTRDALAQCAIPNPGTTGDTGVREIRARNCLTGRSSSLFAPDRFAPVWYCDVVCSIERSCLARYNDELSGVTKLLDFPFRDARQAWCVLARLINWCERVHYQTGVYPVRRSVWDVLLIESDSLILLNTTGLCDVGTLVAYTHTLRVLVLIVYLGCSYGEIDRELSRNDRVSNRVHSCVFPPKTAGVYHALFHKSIMPHRLICGGGEQCSDENAKDNARQWLLDFRDLCERSCERVGLSSPEWHSEISPP